MQEKKTKKASYQLLNIFFEANLAKKYTIETENNCKFSQGKSPTIKDRDDQFQVSLQQ